MVGVPPCICTASGAAPVGIEIFVSGFSGYFQIVFTPQKPRRTSPVGLLGVFSVLNLHPCA